MKDWIYRGMLQLIEKEEHCRKVFSPIRTKLASLYSDPVVRERAFKQLLRHYYKLLYGEENCIQIDSKVFSIVPGHSYSYTASYFESEFPEFVIYGPNSPFKVFIVGDSPSYSEIKNKLNFVGDFGRLLYSNLNCYFESIAPDQIYVTNVCKCSAKMKDKNEVLRRYNPLLFFELALAQPDIVICIGSTPLRYFTRKKLSEAIDEPFTHEINIIDPNGDLELKSIKVFAAPLSALQENIHMLTFANSIAKAMDTYLGKDFGVDPEFEIEVIHTVEQLNTVVERILNKGATDGLQRVAVDLEWSGSKPFSKNSRVLIIGFCWNKTSYIIPLRGRTQDEIEALVAAFKRLFESDYVQIIGYNFMADALWLHSLGIDCSKKWIEGLRNAQDENYPGIFDLLVAFHAFDEASVTNLEEAAKVFLNWKPWSLEIQKYKTKDYGNIPDDVLVPYCAKDCFVLTQLYPVFVSNLHHDGKTGSCWKPYFILMRAIPAYIEMALTGIRIDLDLLYKMIDVYNKAKARLEDELKKFTGFSAFNINSIYHKITSLFGPQYLTGVSRPSIPFCANLTPLKTTKDVGWSEDMVGKETPSTDSETLLYLSSKHPFAELLYYAQSINKLTTSILRPPVLSQDGVIVSVEGLLKYVEDDGRIHPVYYPYLETRRSSSSDPNMQNLPNSEKEELYKKILGDAYPGHIRSIFISDDGFSFVNVDYVGAELLMLGLISNDENLIRDYQCTLLPDDHPDKLDIHSMVAVQAFRLDCPPTKAGLKSIGKEYLRLAAKRIIFGLNYGRGAESCYRQLTAQGMNITFEEVCDIIQYIFTRYPKVKQFQDAVRQRVRNPGWVRNIFGSCRRFPVSRVKESLDEKEREALNFGCQSGVADAISIALFNAYTHPSKPVLNYKCVLQNHDAIVFLVPDENVDVFVSQILPEVMQKQVPLRKIDLEGNPVDDEVYHFGISIEVSKRLPA